jgi:hypothetical protein
MSALASHSPSAAFHARYPRPSPKSPASRLPPTSSPALQPGTAACARTPTPKPQTADAGTQYTPEGYPPTANNTIASLKRRGSSPPPPNMTPRPEPDLPNRSLHSATPIMSQPAASPSMTKKPRTNVDSNVKIMPLKYETCDPKDLGYLISNMLMELIRLNDKLPLNGRLTRFHSR